MVAADPERAALRWETSVKTRLPHLGLAFPRRRLLGVTVGSETRVVYGWNG
jgi:hypothetical protein